jgi:hypothetical protein
MRNSRIIRQKVPRLGEQAGIRKINFLKVEAFQKLKF